jgi:hypothetical protein
VLTASSSGGWQVGLEGAERRGRKEKCAAEAEVGQRDGGGVRKKGLVGGQGRVMGDPFQLPF